MKSKLVTPSPKVYPRMAVGVCVSVKNPFCIGCRYGYPNDTGEAVREPNPGPVAGDGARESAGLIGFADGFISSISGDDFGGVEELDDNDGGISLAGSWIGPGNSPT